MNVSVPSIYFIYLCILIMSEVISEFNSASEDSQLAACLMLFMSPIFLVICSRSLHVVCIFPFEMLTTWKVMFVNIVLSVCLLLEGDVSEKSAYVC